MTDLFVLQVIVALGVTTLVSELVAPRMKLPVPVVQMLCGVLLGFVPMFRQVQLPPASVLLIFLPVLLFWESLSTSLREIRRNLRGVVLLSTFLVVTTAAAVAAVTHALGLALGTAFVLGAALAPTDATAVGVMATGLPRRMATILKAESLVNDGTALVLYSIAVAVVVEHTHPGVIHVGGLFAYGYLVGVLAGAVVAAMGWQLRKRLNDSMVQNLAVLLMPFVAYLIAEAAEASGVLAVVTCGLIMSQVGPR